MSPFIKVSQAPQPVSGTYSVLNKYLLNEYYYVKAFDPSSMDKKTFVFVCFSHFTCIFVNRELGVEDGFNNITKSKVEV